MRKLSMIVAPAAVALAAVIWSALVLASLWTQRAQLNRTAEALARIDAVANLRKDMAIRKWASEVGGIFINEAKAPNVESLSEQERIFAERATGEALKLVLLTPIHILLGIQDITNKEFGRRERLTSLQLHNSANAPDEWEQTALKELEKGATMVTEAPSRKGGHGLLRAMIPMRMDEECLECHRDTLVPVGGLRGGATISLDLNTYRTAQQPTWRAIQYWHFGIWLLGLTALYAIWFFSRRRALELTRQEEERRETEAAFSAMAEGAVITDAQGDILWVNEAFCRIYGYTREEVIGQNPRILKSGRHDAAFYSDFWQQLKMTGHWRGELWNRRKTGDVFPEEISVQALRDADGEIVRFISIFSDITERKQAEEELWKYRQHLEDLVQSRTEELTVARDQAEAASRAKSAFLANMSHELRTPLNAVIGFAQLMDRDPGLSPVQRRNLDIIASSGNHLLTLINDVLELSKIEAGKTPLVVEEVDPAALVSRVVAMMRVRAEQAGLALSLECSALPATVLLDAVKLRQVLLNLLSNAIKFTPAGEVAVKVAGKVMQGGQVTLDISVRDSGVGIAPEDQDRIFLPFEQAAARSHPGGTGLGLTISRQYVEMMGGQLTVESVVGGGSNFRFSLLVPEGVRSPEQPGIGRVLGLAPEDRGRRVLVVDDLIEARLLVRSLLEPLGFMVEEAENGGAVLQKVAALHPDLVLLDWWLPDLDGLEVVRRLRAAAVPVQPAVVMLTANVSDVARQQALEAGADEFLAKPFDEAELFAIIERQLGIAMLRESAAAVPLAAPEIDLGKLDQVALAQLRQAALSLSHDQMLEAVAHVAGADEALAGQLRSLAVAGDFRRLWHILRIVDSP